jgi:hypothetical protein
MADHEDMLTLIAVAAGIGAFEAAAMKFGADSRDPERRVRSI